MNNETKKVDPGWNDPPMLNFNASQPPPRSRIGNKRVPFPLGSTPAVQKPALPLNIDQPSSEEPVEDLAEVTLTNFKSLLNSGIANEVHEKIQLMEGMWKMGQFPTSMKNDLYKLSDSIVRKDYETANKLNLDLHMKYPNQCKDWILAIRFLIHDK
ncbi:protein transport protein sec31-like isoform X2 [Harmonia axyridis]|uniref:protein transport protein sec31-like isoform X2 n=1 Tax=Harmonia axyridis TaxID=115357 RepID=UPI001E27516D|nr:protein transport protein sec31-like isoform X2 [Harmonia axyridis]